MRQSWVCLAVLAVALTAVRPAAAITYGQPDGNAHPYVGLVLFYDAAGTPLHRCSGTLLSPTVLLTAGHCTFGTARAQVWFAPEVTTASGYPNTGGVTGTPYTHPAFVDNFRISHLATAPNSSDLGIVVLDRPVYLAAYGMLPPLGLLDGLATQPGLQSQVFTVVGYGIQEVRPNFQVDRVRYRATTMVVNLRSALTDGYNLHASNNPGIGGGICFGDSGGPVLLGNTHILVAVTSFLTNANCKGAGFAYRTDIVNAQNFIRPFLR